MTGKQPLSLQVFLDVEREGSMGRRREDKVVYPTTDNGEVQHQDRPHAISYMETPSKKWKTWIIPAFVVANFVVFIATMAVNDCPKNSEEPGKCVPKFLGRMSFQPLKQNPLLGPSSSTLEKMGGLDWIDVVQKHQGWRLITCIWLHAGVVHLLSNMLSLVFIGIRLEQEFGFFKIGMLYLLSGFGGSLLSALFIQNNISVGASGALFGLLGAMLSELLTNWTIYASKLAALVTLVLIIVVNLAFGLLPHVDNFAHLGGFMSGFLLGFVFLIRPQFGWVNRKKLPLGYELDTSVKHKHKPYQYVLWLSALILITIGYAVGLAMVLRGVNANDHCGWCHYLSCVPTSKWSCKEKPVYCLSSQSQTELTLTCENGGKTKIFPFGNASDDRIRDLCTQLCA
ncbi:RHOMBOID-like protein 2 [Cryptomeria japonica]|uniref:RHOMBOID-like protein 2 n=1 Tax=Cryptomeria japonica TaxID=3369 RepID=UPI0025ACFFC0|nr:RHOMBOID-like protein 2 [Cryptomeria japonica]